MGVVHVVTYEVSQWETKFENKIELLGVAVLSFEIAVSTWGQKPSQIYQKVIRNQYKLDLGRRAGVVFKHLGLGVAPGTLQGVVRKTKDQPKVSILD